MMIDRDIFPQNAYEPWKNKKHGLQLYLSPLIAHSLKYVFIKLTGKNTAPLAFFKNSTIREPSVCEIYGTDHIFYLPRMSKFDGSMVYHEDTFWPAFPLTATGTN